MSIVAWGYGPQVGTGGGSGAGKVRNVEKIVFVSEFPVTLIDEELKIELEMTKPIEVELCEEQLEITLEDDDSSKN